MKGSVTGLVFTYVHNGDHSRVEAMLFRMMGTHYSLNCLGLLRRIVEAANDD